jgi:5'-nucleotidase
MAAALEAAIDDIPAIGFSLCDYAPDADFTQATEHVEQITRQVLEKGLPLGVALNVNIPSKKSGQIKGVKVCRQARARWKEAFDERIDPYGERYFWMAGDFLYMDEGEDNDVWAIDNNYIAIVPTQCDMTSHAVIRELKNKIEGN